MHDHGHVCLRVTERLAHVAYAHACAHVSVCVCVSSERACASVLYTVRVNACKKNLHSVWRRTDERYWWTLTQHEVVMHLTRRLMFEFCVAGWL